MMPSTCLLRRNSTDRASCSRLFWESQMITLYPCSCRTRSMAETIFMVNRLESSGSTMPTVRLFLDFNPRAYSFTW